MSSPIIRLKRKHCCWHCCFCDVWRLRWASCGVPSCHVLWVSFTLDSVSCVSAYLWLLPSHLECLCTSPSCLFSVPHTWHGSHNRFYIRIYVCIKLFILLTCSPVLVSMMNVESSVLGWLALVLSICWVPFLLAWCKLGWFWNLMICLDFWEFVRISCLPSFVDTD